jgi:hypothetical protein
MVSLLAGVCGYSAWKHVPGLRGLCGRVLVEAAAGWRLLVSACPDQCALTGWVVPPPRQPARPCTPGDIRTCGGGGLW